MNDSQVDPQAEEIFVPPPALKPARDVRWVFLGPNGLRAGWGIFIFAAIWFVFSQALEWFLARRIPIDLSAPLGPGIGMVIEVAQFLPVVIATWVMALIERRSVLAYGYEGRPRAERLLAGVVWGFIAISGLVLTLWKLGYLSLQRGSVSPIAALEDAAVWGLIFLIAGFFEESLFRGYVQFTLTRGIGFWWGAVIFSLLFAFAHTTNPGESWIGLASVVGAGIVFSLSLWYTGSLWWAVGFHAAWDWGQSYFYGTADSGMKAKGTLLQGHPQGPVFWSGGTTGPEGSVLVVAALVLIAGAMIAWWGTRARSPFAGAAWRPLRVTQINKREVPTAL
ncbi:MAG: CPBP family intramembrane glutamic endopeptidase [Acidobacteriaceae bacterium]